MTEEPTSERVIDTIWPLSDDPRRSPGGERVVDRTARFWDRIARRYAAKPVADQATYERKLAATREHLHPGMSVLEIGCGTGTTAIAHAPLVDRIRAVDVSPRMLEIARGRARDAGVANVDFECAAFDALEIADESVDAVLALSVLHLLADWRGAISRIHGMLRPGGVFVSSTACLDDGARFLRPVASLGRALGFLPRLSFFDRPTFEAAIADPGFRIEQAWRPSRRQGLFVIAFKAGGVPMSEPSGICLEAQSGTQRR